MHVPPINLSLLAEVHMSPRSEQSFTAYVGIDWADTKHDICVQVAGDTRRQFGCIAHGVAAIDEWATALHRRFGGPVAVAVELAKGPIVAALQKYDFLVLFPINPAILAKYREAFQPSGAKDDPADAELALDLLLHHPERFSALRPQSAAMRSLVRLVERRLAPGRRGLRGARGGPSARGAAHRAGQLGEAHAEGAGADEPADYRGAHRRDGHDRAGDRAGDCGRRA